MGAGQAARSRAGGRVPRWLGPVALLVMTLFFVGVVVWGLVNPTEIRVEYFDAGRADAFEIGQLTAFPEHDLYVVGLQDGRLRAIDGRVEGTECRVSWIADDTRGRAHNPGGVSGVFEDPCTGAVWSMEANAIEGATEPLRTPYIDYRPGTDGALHAFIERVNP